MKPFLEHLQPPADASWAMLNRRLDHEIPFQWHHHPEFELTLTLNSKGQRFIGDHVGSYDHGDLALVGPNLPHTWASREKLDEAKPHVALVFWFRKEWIESLTASTVELRPIERLITRGMTGLSFGSELGLELADEYQDIYTRDPAQRLMGLINILLRVAAADGEPLAMKTPREMEAKTGRIDRVLLHLHQHHHEVVRLEELAEIANLSVSGLHRMFLKHMQVTISDYLIGLRIGEACARLSGTSQPIQHIASEVGYASLANFNRHFKRRRGLSPRQYRSSFAR